MLFSLLWSILCGKIIHPFRYLCLLILCNYLLKFVYSFKIVISEKRVFCRFSWSPLNQNKWKHILRYDRNLDKIGRKIWIIRNENVESERERSWYFVQMHPTYQLFPKSRMWSIVVRISFQIGLRFFFEMNLLANNC